MIKPLLATVALAAIAAGTSARAADMPVKAPAYRAPPPAVFTWTGFYVGANAGYGWDTGSIDLAAVPPFTAFFAPAIARGEIPPSSDLHARGFIGGLQAGYNFQSGPIVYGVETDFSYARVRGTALNVSNGLLNPVITTAQDSNLHWLGTLRGRLGVLPTPVSLFYVTGGLAYGHTAASTTTTVPTVTFPTVPPSVSRCPDLNLFCSTGSSSKTRAGWTIGGGLEYAFGQNWSAKLEYLYYDLGRESYLTVTQAALAPTPVMQADAKFAGHIARVGINYRFGGPVVARY